MTNQTTPHKLIEMRLTSIADAFRIQMDDSSMKEVPFEDLFGMLVDVEYSSRKNNRLKRLIRSAELATCEYIIECRNIFIARATGSGKTYMACALGMEACKHFYSVK